MKISNFVFTNEFKIKKLDIAIIIFLIVLSILPTFFFARGAFEGKDRYAVIYVNGEVYKEIKLGEGLDHSLEIRNGKGENLVKIESYDVYMFSANCYDRYCVKQGRANDVGDTIVCLPNRVVVEITGKEVSVIDDISR